MDTILKIAKQNMIKNDKMLSPFATKSANAVLLKKDTEDIRPTFFRDIDKIIHSGRIYKVYR